MKRKDEGATVVGATRGRFTGSAIESGERAVCTIPEAGAMLGIGRASAYLAAARGEIPTLKLGGRRVVPLVQLRRMLAGEARVDGAS